MLRLPNSTEVNRRIAKEKIYANANLTKKVQNMIKYQVESIVWRNKLAESTMAVASGETVKEIQVFEVALRQCEFDKCIIRAIEKAIPYKILFMLSFGGKAQAWIEAAGTYYNTQWQSHNEITLQFEGLNLDAVYESLARQIAGGRLGVSGDIADAVEKDKQRQKLNREIAALEKKVLLEKQFGKQVEMNGELKRLRKELEEMK